MRIALLQTRLDPTSHAANTQQLAQAIDRAASIAPAPDLLVLPGGCDTGGMSPGRGHSYFHVAGVRETLAWKAREWGLFVAAGLHKRQNGGWATITALFDPDGDIAASSGGAGPTIPDERTVEGVPVWHSSVGTIGVFTRAPGDDSECRVVAPAGGLVVVSPIVAVETLEGPEALDAKREGMDQNVQLEGNVFCALVFPAGPASAGRGEANGVSCLLGPGGDVVARAEGQDEEIICAEIPIEPAKEAS